MEIRMGMIFTSMEVFYDHASETMQFNSSSSFGDREN